MDAALFELLLFFGIVLGLACWELYRVDRSLRRPQDESSDGAADEAANHGARGNASTSSADDRDD